MSSGDEKSSQKQRRGRPPSNPNEQLAAIRKAALSLLSNYGYRKTTMLAIAKSAGISKETLYSLYSSKVTLFEALIRSNAEKMNNDLTLASERSYVALVHSLFQFGCNLLSLLTSDASIAINRAAIELAPENTIFSQALLTHGRERVMPLLVKLIDRAVQQGRLKPLDTKEAANHFVAILVGDLQHRLLLGVSEPPEKEIIEQRSEQAVTLFLKLYS
jgi:AcrR family transcriptional regulator